MGFASRTALDELLPVSKRLVFKAGQHGAASSRLAHGADGRVYAPPKKSFVTSLMRINIGAHAIAEHERPEIGENGEYEDERVH